MVTSNGRILQIQGILERAELVRVSFGGEGHDPSKGDPPMRVVVRSGNPDIRSSLGDATPDGVAKFPMPLGHGELQLEFGDGCPGVRISSRSEPPTSWSGTDDPDFQTWLERQIEKARVRAGANRSHALQSSSVRGQGAATQWAAIFEPGQVGLRAPRQPVAATLGA